MEDLEVKLEFDQIKNLIYNYCLSNMGQQMVNEIQFSTDPYYIKELLDQNQEFKIILEENSNFPTQYYIDVRTYLEQAKVQGKFLSGEVFLDIKNSLFTILDCVRFLNSNKERFPNLYKLTEEVTIGNKLAKSIDATIDDKGYVRDNASKDLKEIRDAINKEKARLRDKIQSILQKNKNKGYADPHAEVTIRGERLVIPIWAEHKRHVKGFIHGESSTGQTTFIEPEEVLESNNRIREMGYEEQREVAKILTRLTNLLRPNIPALQSAYAFLGQIDLIRAKSRLAIELNAQLPALEETSYLSLYKAVHPLLYLHHKKINKDIVPLDLELNHENHLLLISGPNAGGKSVCLKTVGLLQYMIQCGLLIPVQENSTIGLFENLYIDIGDEQSIENDLSTYSSHLSTMKEMAEKAGNRDMILIDELGTGTDPSYGGAMGEAVLEYLNDNQVFGVITTHYSNIKQFASRTGGIKNGAMLFDEEQLQPLFKLSIGNPGSSFALEIADKIGLPDKIIEKAREKVGEKQIKLDQLLQEAEKEKKKLQEQNKELEKTKERLNKTANEYEELKKHTERRRKEILNQAKSDANLLIKDANKKIEKALKDVNDKEVKKENLHKNKAELDHFKENLKPEKEKTKKQSSSQDKQKQEPLEVGDWVKIDDQPGSMQVINLYDKEAEVSIGELKSIVKRTRLKKVDKGKKEDITSGKKKHSGKHVQFHQKGAEFNPNLDIRGYKPEEAIKELENFIDRALMLGAKDLRIIHGKGSGVLRDVVRKNLKSYSQVKDMKDEDVEQGGAGVTIVKMK